MAIWRNSIKRLNFIKFFFVSLSMTTKLDILESQNPYGNHENCLEKLDHVADPQGGSPRVESKDINFLKC